MCQRTKLDAINRRAQRQASILHDLETMLFGYGHDGNHVCRMTIHSFLPCAACLMTSFTSSVSLQSTNAFVSAYQLIQTGHP